MKKIILILSAALIFIVDLSAQNEDDALRYSRQYVSGSARSVAMGGAMGAIGGDFTTLSINPAGIGVYRSNEFSFSPSINWNTTSSDFLSNKIEQTRYGMKIGNIGYVATHKSGKDEGIISTSFGFGYNQLNNFSQQVYMSGINNTSSMLDNFTNVSNNNPSNVSDFYEQLAYNVDIVAFDTVTSKYFNDFNRSGYGQLQERKISSSGSLGEYAFSMGANYSDRIYFGATFGVQRVRYESSIEHTETDQNKTIDYTDQFVFHEDLLTRGYGLNLKLGIIARPVDFLRLGLAYHIPTFYFLNDRFSTDISATYDNNLGINPKSSSSDLGIYDYQLKSPSKLVGSAAVTIGKLGMISMDYERINYAGSNLQATDYAFISENNAIKDNYKVANNLRFGAELRMGTGYLRGGYGIYGSPFKVVDPKAEDIYKVISGGIGLRTSDFFMDLAYSSGNSSQAYYMYLPENANNPSFNKSNLNNIVLTVGFRF
ncbi:MAG: hypothetical protein H6540_06045 [Bacteroidales bacterium]|nr:hypothetical protein [Bacteroidales bacterium]MCP5515567.1 hypothetical protein [Spirochaetales bacterium]